jgi:acyl-CoA synthetase (AMP-forming)/AMP-acid ligase II
MAALIRKFEEICASNGDDNCFYISEYYGGSSSSSNHNQKTKKSLTKTTASNPNTLPKTSVGFSELNENIKLIANEMYFRHSIGGPKSFTTSTNARFDSCSVPSQEQIRQSCANSVLIVSDQPSPGEAAAVMACVKLQSVFVPISLNGLHRTSDRRLQIILEETKPIAAIVVLTVVAPEGAHITESDDWETKPALSTNEIIDVDSHSTIMKLNSLGVHRIITVNGLDGSVIGGMAGLSVGEVDLPTMQVDYDDRQPMYILYTSGSTSRPKAVVQTYSGLLNRIQWQWRVFPFVQQIRRNVGYNETVELLKQDGILKCKNGERLYDINDIVLRRTSLSFVDAMAEIFGTLLGGAALFCPMWIERIGQEQQWQGVGLSAMLDVARRDKIRVTRMTCLPSQLGQAFRHSENDQCLNGGDYSWTKTLNMVIVSGEPCSLTLPSLFEKQMYVDKAILVNLYGQTETSGDVSCLVASSGKRGQSLSRFPLASKYIWNGPSHFKSTGGSNFIDNCVKSLVPCGLPIDGHVIMFKPNMSTDDASSSRVGCLHVSGPGVALGYSNNKYEMIANFSVSQNENKKGRAEVVSNLTFNTMDLAFQDDEGIVYVVGRAPRDIDDVASNDGNLCSLTMGKLNGKKNSEYMINCNKYYFLIESVPNRCHDPFG